jgi:hypothetical protein
LIEGLGDALSASITGTTRFVTDFFPATEKCAGKTLKSLESDQLSAVSRAIGNAGGGAGVTCCENNSYDF